MKNIVVIGASSKEHVQYFYLNVLEAAPDFSFLPDEVHGMVYCPGSINLKPFKRIKPEEFVEDYQLQTIGAIKSIQAVLPKMKNVENAAIVLFSTVAVQTGFNFHTQVAASKGAIEGLSDPWQLNWHRI
jgi:NAD(P)-dependent dehydrogenase (short-subunit alcohol dehydrogenase family)